MKYKALFAILFLMMLMPCAMAKVITTVEHPLHVNIWDVNSIPQGQNYTFTWDSDIDGLLQNNTNTMCTFFLIQAGTTNQIFGGTASDAPGSYGHYVTIDGRNLTVLGDYNWQVDCFLVANTSISGNALGTFVVTPNGNIASTPDILAISLALLFVALLAVIFYIVAMTIKNFGIRLFFIALAGMALLACVGMALSYGENYLYQFTEFLNLYNAIYILLLIIGSTALIGLIVWFIVYVFTLFSKIKIGNTDIDMDMGER